MPAIETRRWTVEEVHAIPEDGNRYECIDGELFVSPSPVARHQRALFDLGVMLHAFVARDPRIGWVWIAPSDLIIGPGTIVQPDLRVHMAGPTATAAEIATASLLIVEVLSPSTARLDRHQKRRLYMSGPAELYWIVDLASEMVEVWAPGVDHPSIVTDTLRWQPRGASAPFTLELAPFFADANAWGEVAR
jgi:Uma2 family endonuclease